MALEPQYFIISNEEIEDIIKIVKSLEGSGFLIEEVTQTIKNKIRKTQRRIFWNIIKYIRCYFVGNMSTGKMQGWGTIKTGKGSIKAGKDF